MTREEPNRKRLAPDARRSQLLAVAAQMILEQGALPLSIAELGRKAGVSKALFYAYFPDQHDLVDAILLEHFALLESAGLSAAGRKRDLSEAAIASSSIYFDHVAEYGPVLHVILRDPFVSSNLSREVRAFRDRVFGALARLGRRKLRLNAREAVAAASLILTIPEEAGRLAFDGEMKRERAKELCLDLVTSALKAITPAN